MWLKYVLTIHQCWLYNVHDRYMPQKVKNIKGTPKTKLENGGENWLFPISKPTNSPNSNDLGTYCTPPSTQQHIQINFMDCIGFI